MAPKVFISHASEDKERFVLGFAERLRKCGVDAWLDRWEMLPGDSLVDKIFEEGIKSASAVVVVLSANSVSKRWVREELNAAFVQRVNAGSKLIPVLIDTCEVPASLASTLWQRIPDLDSYEEQLKVIVAAIFGYTDKPVIGAPPLYVGTSLHEIEGLTKSDNLVLKSACEIAMRTGSKLIKGGSDEFIQLLGGLPEEEVGDSLEMLEKSDLAELHRHLGGGLPSFSITTAGFQRYAFAYVDGYEKLIESAGSAIVNESCLGSNKLAERLGCSRFLADHALEVLEANGYIKVSWTFGGGSVWKVSPELRRAFS